MTDTERIAALEAEVQRLTARISNLARWITRYDASLPFPEGDEAAVQALKERSLLERVDRLEASIGGLEGWLGQLKDKP